MNNKVMVVDDDASILELMKIILEENGYEPILLSEGTTLLRNISKYRPAVILLDIWLSGLDGSYLVKKIKENKEFNKIPVLLLSANNNVEMVAKNTGADDFLSKPFDINNLLVKLQKYTA